MGETRHVNSWKEARRAEKKLEKLQKAQARAKAAQEDRIIMQKEESERLKREMEKRMKDTQGLLEKLGFGVGDQEVGAWEDEMDEVEQGGGAQDHTEDTEHVRFMSHNAGKPVGTLQMRYWDTRRRQHPQVVCLQDHRKGKLTKSMGNRLAANALGAGSKGVWVPGNLDAGGSWIGGTAVLVGPELAPRIKRVFLDESGLGRFCGVELRGQGGMTHTVLSTYNAPVSTAPGSMWLKQQRTLKSAPDEMHWADLAKLLLQLRAAGSTYVVMGDMNTLWSADKQDGQRQWGTGGVVSSSDKRRTKLLRRFAEEANLSNWLQQQGKAEHTWRKSLNRQPEATIDHTLVSQGIKVVNGWVERGIHNNSDHQPMWLEVHKDMFQAGKRNSKQGYRPQGPQYLKGISGDETKQEKYTEKVQEIWEQRCIGDKILDLENSIAKGSLDNLQIRELMDTIHADIAEASIRAETSLEKQTGGPPGERYYDGWSPEMAMLVKAIRLMRRLLTVWKGTKSPVMVREEVEKIGKCKGWVRCPESNDPEEWKKFVSQTWLLQKELRGKLHGAARTAERKKISARVRERETNREVGKLKRYFNAILEKPCNAIMENMLVKDAEGREHLITDPGELSREAVYFFSEWMGKNRDRWYVASGCPLYSDTEEGRELRKRVADQHEPGKEISEETLEQWGIPIKLLPVIKCLGRKPTNEGDLAEEGKFIGVMDRISRNEWRRYWREKKKHSAPGKSGLTVAQVALLHEDGMEGLRALANCIIQTGCMGAQMCREILIPIPKDPNNPARERLRPLKLQEVLKKAVMGILMRRLTDRLLKLGLLDTAQYGFLPGKDTSLPLMGLKAITDFCNYWRRQLAVLAQDIRHAYDTVEFTVGKEMPLRRLGAPEAFINLIRELDGNKRTEVASAHGLSGDVLGEEGWFQDETGWGQGGEESPMGWDIFFDVILTLMQSTGGKPLELTNAEGEVVVRTWGMAYADDALWLAPDRETMQQRVDASGLFYQFMGMENEPQKDVYTEMVHSRTRTGDDPQWMTAEENPGTVTAQEGLAQVTPPGRTVNIRRLEPHEAWRYLGKTEGVGWDGEEKQIEHTTKQVEEAVQLIRYKRVSAEGLRSLLNTVIGPKVRYPLQYMALDLKTVDDIQQRTRGVWRARAGICEKAPLQAFEYNDGVRRWGEDMLADQITKWLRTMNDQHSGIQEMMELSIRQRRRWVGTAGSPLGPELAGDARGDKTWLGMLIQNAASLDIELTGAQGMQSQEEEDENIVDASPLDIRADIMQGCRIHGIWWGEQAKAFMRGERQSEEDLKGLTGNDKKAHDKWMKFVQVRYGPPDHARTRMETGWDTHQCRETQKDPGTELTRGEVIGEVQWEAEEVAKVEWTDRIFACSDGSTHYMADKTSFGLLVYMVREGGLVKLGTCKGCFRADPSTVSSFRAEAQGILAMATMVNSLAAGELSIDLPGGENLQQGLNRVELQLDNEAAVKVWNRLEDVTPNEWLQLEDQDVWKAAAAEKARMQDDTHVEVSWHRGHPERDISRTSEQWTVQEWAAFRSDELAKEAYAMTPCTGTLYQVRDRWGVKVGGKQVTGKFRSRLLQHMQVVRLKQYLRDKWNWEEEEIESREWRTITESMHRNGPVHSTIRKLKLRTAWLATMEVLCKRGQAATGECPLCKKGTESTTHLLGKCTHPTLVEVREKAVREVKQGAPHELGPRGYASGVGHSSTAG